jgi:hypothetical protein
MKFFVQSKLKVTMKILILFCCQKSAIYYLGQNKNRVKCIYQESIGRKYLIKVDVIDEELNKQYLESVKCGSLYVIDVKDDSATQIKSSDIVLNHMGIILNETDSSKSTPHMNIYNIGLLCFMSCPSCKQEGCPAKSACCKLAIDVVRLWNTMGYNPEKIDDSASQKIKQGLLELYQNHEELYANLPGFIKKEMTRW